MELFHASTGDLIGGISQRSQEIKSCMDVLFLIEKEAPVRKVSIYSCAMFLFCCNHTYYLLPSGQLRKLFVPKQDRIKPI